MHFIDWVDFTGSACTILLRKSVFLINVDAFVQVNVDTITLY